MKDVDDMTIEEALEELRPLLLDYEPTNKSDCEQRLVDLYYKLKEYYNDAMLHNFTAEIEYLYNGKYYKLTTNLTSGEYFEALNVQGYDDFQYGIQEGGYESVCQEEIDKRCTTFTLEELQKELTDEVLQDVFKGHHVVSFKYLLENRRKEVVEWALKHKNELGLKKEDAIIAEQGQPIFELEQLILKTL